ncbi:MAG: hypothetical protein ACLGGW_09195 [Gammaproteobacteria bacterium]
MLAAGESPEWIAFQMGHSSTEMLFKVYSRYVPNLTRRDGSAFERMLAANLGPGVSPPVAQTLVAVAEKSSASEAPKQTPQPRVPKAAPTSFTPVTGVNQASKPAIQSPWLQMFESYQNKNTQGE